MDEVGRVLRDAREAKGLSLNDVYAQLRITPAYLEAMEEGAFHVLPSEANARGYLRKYARFLKLDDEQILESYARLQTDRPPQPTPVESTPVPQEPILDLPTAPEGGTFFNHLNEELVVSADQGPGQERVGWVIIVALIIFIGLLTYRFLPQLLGNDAISAIPGLESAVEAQLLEGTPAPPTQTPIPTPIETTELIVSTGRTNGGAADDGTGDGTSTGTTSEEITEQLPPPTPTRNPLPATIDVIDLTIDVTERAWVRIVVDDITVFEGQVTGGDTLSYIGTDYVTIRTGNGYGLVVQINDTELGRLGERNQVIDITWETVQ